MKHFILLLSLILVSVGVKANVGTDTQPEIWSKLTQLKTGSYFTGKLQEKLSRALASDRIDQVVSVIKEGANVNDIGRNGMRPLLWAMSNETPKGFQILLENGADPNVKVAGLIEFDRPLSVMELAAVAKVPDYLQLALKFGGDPNFPLGYGERTIIYAAILNGRIENVRVLCDFRVNLSQRDTAGETPLMTAASVNYYDLVYLFLERGADPLLRNRWGFDLAGRMKKYGTRGMNPSGDEFKWYLRVSEEMRKRGLLD